MSKTALILITLCFLAGIALVMFLDFNPTTAMLSLAEDPVGSLETMPDMLIGNWQAIATGIGGSISALALFSRTYSQKKQEAQEIQRNLQGQLIAESDAKAKVQAQVDALNTTIDNQSELITAKGDEINRLKLTVGQLERHNRRLLEAQQSANKLRKDEVIQLIHKETRKP